MIEFLRTVLIILLDLYALSMMLTIVFACGSMYYTCHPSEFTKDFFIPYRIFWKK